MAMRRSPQAPSGEGEEEGAYTVLAEGPADPMSLRDGAANTRFLAKVQRNRKTNIQMAMHFTFISTLVFSIIQWNIFDAYLSFLAKSLGMKYINSSVGVAESIAGITSLVLAIPVGLLVDNYSRTKLLKVSAVFGIVASIVSAYAFAFDSIVPLYTNLFLWGIYTQISGSASEAIFADSIQAGKRSEIFTFKGILERLGLSLGPAIMVLLFYVSGDNWSLRELHIPLILGCAIAPFPCFLLMLFRDPHPEVFFPASPVSPLPLTAARDLLCSPSPMAVRTHLTSASPAMPLPAADELTSVSRNDEKAHFENLSWQETSIPYIVAFSDFIRKVGAGMTIKFFPLFFINDYGFKPIHINILFCAYPLFMSVFAWLLQKLSKPIGRAQAASIFQVLGIVFLLGMYYFENLWLMIIFFILRGSIQNSGFPIDKSIIMDYVPSNRRGLWNAIESITCMTWSGSAVLGGFLSDFHDYRYTFLITATIYAFAALVYLPLLWLVPKNEGEMSQMKRCKAVRTKVVPSTPCTDVPPSSKGFDSSDDFKQPIVVLHAADEFFLSETNETDRTVSLLDGKHGK